MNAPAEKVDHAYANAKAWAESIAEMVAAMRCDYDRLEELRDAKDDADTPMDSDEAAELAELEKECSINGDKMDNADEARERIEQSPLSVEVRSGWYTPGADHEPEDFSILLSTGGPALRIRGELDAHKQPSRAWLEYQDWGTPWTEYHGDGCGNETLLEFCSVFYFGE